MCLMNRGPPRATRTDTLLPDTTLCRALGRLCPLELTERQSVLLTNPAYGAHGIKGTKTIRIASSIYKTGDVARPHMHTPNASRTIISDGGDYTMVEGERIRDRKSHV